MLVQLTVNALITAANAGATKMTFTVDGKDIALDFNSVTGGAVKAVAATGKGDEMTTFGTALQTDLNEAIKDYNATVPTDKQVSNVSVSVKDGSFVFKVVQLQQQVVLSLIVVMLLNALELQIKVVQHKVGE